MHFGDKSTLKYAVPSDYFSFLTWGLELYHKAVKTESTEEAELLYRVSGMPFLQEAGNSLFALC